MNRRRRVLLVACLLAFAFATVAPAFCDCLEPLERPSACCGGCEGDCCPVDPGESGGIPASHGDRGRADGTCLSFAPIVSAADELRGPDPVASVAAVPAASAGVIFFAPPPAPPRPPALVPARNPGAPPGAFLPPLRS